MLRSICGLRKLNSREHIPSVIRSGLDSREVVGLMRQLHELPYWRKWSSVDDFAASLSACDVHVTRRFL
jgi:hypothetical protein